MFYSITPEIDGHSSVYTMNSALADTRNLKYLKSLERRVGDRRFKYATCELELLNYLSIRAHSSLWHRWREFLSLTNQGSIFPDLVQSDLIGGFRSFLPAHTFFFGGGGGGGSTAGACVVAGQIEDKIK